MTCNSNGSITLPTAGAPEGYTFAGWVTAAVNNSTTAPTILTGSYENSQRFLREVDASAVMVNASTRFNDGGQFGLGMEIGISTSKLHAYGPMGLTELTTVKYLIEGNGQIR